MAELTRDETRYYHVSDQEEYPVAAGEIIYEGAAVGDNGAGYARPLVAGDRFLGFATRQTNNSIGIAGALRVHVKTSGTIRLLVAGADASVNNRADVYASDDNTFTLIANSNSRIGNIVGRESGNIAVVKIDGNRFKANIPSGDDYVLTPMAMWGDSLTNGVGGKPPSLFISRWSHVEVYNGAQTGGTSTQIKALFDAGSAYWGRPTIIWAGRNNFSSPSTVKADIAAMVASLTTSKFIILSILNGTYELAGSADYNTIMQLNNDLATLYPGHYLDIRAHLVSQYDPDIAQDVIDHGNDVSPSSLRSDTLHLNAAGYEIVARYIFANIDKLFDADEEAVSVVKGLSGQSILKTKTSNNIDSLEIFESGNVGIGVSGAVATDALEVAGNIVSKGLAWTVQNAAADNTWKCIAYGDGIFVAVSSTGTGNRVMTSPDGVNWTSRTSAADNPWNSVCWGNGLFVAVSSTGTGNRVMTSPDGITWTARANPEDNDYYEVCYGNGLFVAVCQSSTSGKRVMTSPDGIVWTLRTAAASNAWNSVCYGNGLFVAVSLTGTNTRVMTSPDGITWTGRTSAANNTWESVCYGNGIFVAVASTGTGNRIMTSPDGITWTSRTASVDNNWTSVCYGAGLFVAVAGGTTGIGNKVMTSPDGITWTLRSPGIPNQAADLVWQSIAYGNGIFAAIATSGAVVRVMTSGRMDKPEQKRNVFNSGVVVNGGITVDKTVTAGGTTGAQTINNTAGSVNFAAGAASLVVTNSLVTANSIIQLTVGTNDATMKSAIAVAGAGSFTIYADAVPTAETRVNFTVTN